MQNDDYADYILHLLSRLDNIRSRKMFGGHGFYKNGIFFALIANDILYFKVDECNRPAYEKYGSTPFTYERKDGRPISINYFQVPEDILEDHTKLAEWADQAVQAACRSKVSKRRKKRPNDRHSLRNSTVKN